MKKNREAVRVLVLGANGMLGSSIFRFFSSSDGFSTFGTVRNKYTLKYFSSDFSSNLISDVNFDGEDGLLRAFSISRPDVVINCVGIVKQLPQSSDFIESLAINAALPHRLARYCSLINARLIQFSTDCVFSGKQGDYTEKDFPDASDLYGRSKLLGEVEYDHCVTLRTSIIGHELGSNKSLIDWFLSQSNRVNGFRKAVFSGLPTVEVAEVVRDHVIPNNSLRGVYHLSAEPINKFDLLSMVAAEYEKDIDIFPDDALVIDRSLNSNRFKVDSGYVPPSWEEMICKMNKEFVRYHQSF